MTEDRENVQFLKIMYISTMPKRILVFDFDGVIIDSFETCWNIMREAEPNLTVEEYRARFEGNINASIANKTSVRQTDFFTKYEAIITDLPAFPGMVEVIKTLSTHYLLFIVSSTTTALITKYLEHYSLLEYFTKVLGNDVSESKEKKLRSILKTHKVSPKDVLFITDTLGDLKEVHAVSIKGLAVTWGFNSEETLKKGNPAVIVKIPQEIPEAVANELH